MQIERCSTIFQSIKSCLYINKHILCLYFKIIFTNTFKSGVDEILVFDKFLVLQIMAINKFADKTNSLPYLRFFLFFGFI